MHHNIRISVCAICRNEEEDLPAFLENVLPLVDEVVLVDDGSTDATPEIARKAAPKVKFIRNAMGPDKHFANQRNFAADEASGEWLLHMDIDERITPELYRSIRDKITNPTLNGLRYRRLNFFLNRKFDTGGWQDWNKPQLARKGKHRFVNEIHEECVIDGGEMAIGQLDGYMWHLVDKDYTERLEKNLRYAKAVSARILKRGIRVKWYHIILHPAYRAFRAYFLKGAIRKGVAGLIFAFYTFSGTMNWWIFAWEQQNRVSRKALEERIKELWRHEEA